MQGDQQTILQTSKQTNQQTEQTSLQTKRPAHEVAPERRRKHAMHLFDARTIARPPAEVFRYLTDSLPAAYRELSPAHQYFVVEGGGPVREGSVIACRERAANQEVHHRYVVLDFEPAAHLYYASTPSRTFVHLNKRVIADESDTHVYYDLHEAHEGAGTRIEMTIVIQLRKRLSFWLAVATGSTGLWRRHLAEELTNLKQLIEAA